MNHERVIALALELAQAKTAEDQANAARIAVEEKLVRELDFTKPDGSQTYNAEHNGSRCKVVCKQPVNLSLDEDAVGQLMRTLDKKHPARALFLPTWKFDTKAGRELQEKNLDAFRVVAGAITRRPGKVQVSVDQLVVV